MYVLFSVVKRMIIGLIIPLLLTTDSITVMITKNIILKGLVITNYLAFYLLLKQNAKGIGSQEVTLSLTVSAIVSKHMVST